MGVKSHQTFSAQAELQTQISGKKLLSPAPKADGAVFNRSHSSRIFATTAPPASWDWVSSTGVGPLVRGREAVIAKRGMLVELSRRTGQLGVMDILEHLVHSPTALDKTPYLVLSGLRAGVPAARATADDVAGAVLVYEYRIAGLGLRVFATDDVTGRRTVLAPDTIRAKVAEEACGILVNAGAQVALISLEGRPEPVSRPMGVPTQPGGYRIAVRTRTFARDLLLKDTLEATLAAVGRNTRRNLRRYRQRLEEDLGATFVSSAQMGPAEVVELNRSSKHPIADAEALWRYECLQATPNRLLAGVRAADGRWLSVVAGRRNGDVTEIEWQMNQADLPHYSLSTVMRSYLLEHEIALGMRKIIFLGGTPHAMRHSLVASESGDVLIVRRSVRARLLCCLCRWVFPQSNFLRGMLLDKDVAWTK
jgi:hypothetical protein